MNTKKVCLGLASMLSMICAPALACGGDGYQGSYGNGFGNMSMQQNYGQRNRHHRRHYRQWQQRQLSQNDPYYNYWNQNPAQYQGFLQSQQNLPGLVSQGVITPQEQALLAQQMAAYQQQMNGGYGNPYAQNPFGYTSYPGGNGAVGNFINGIAGNGGNPFINAAIPGLLQRLAGYWGGQTY